jgi:hypothetical protein
MHRIAIGQPAESRLRGPARTIEHVQLNPVSLYESRLTLLDVKNKMTSGERTVIHNDLCNAYFTFASHASFDRFYLTQPLLRLSLLLPHVLEGRTIHTRGESSDLRDESPWSLPFRTDAAATGLVLSHASTKVRRISDVQPTVVLGWVTRLQQIAAVFHN